MFEKNSVDISAIDTIKHTSPADYVIPTYFFYLRLTFDASAPVGMSHDLINLSRLSIIGYHISHLRDR